MSATSERNPGDTARPCTHQQRETAAGGRWLSPWVDGGGQCVNVAEADLLLARPFLRDLRAFLVQVHVLPADERVEVQVLRGRHRSLPKGLDLRPVLGLAHLLQPARASRVRRLRDESPSRFATEFGCTVNPTISYAATQELPNQFYHHRSIIVCSVPISREREGPDPSRTEGRKTNRV